MSYTDWPTKVGGNDFALAKLDPETPFQLKVTTWSNLFGDGGSVKIDGYDADGKRHYMDFGSIRIERNGSVKAEREHLQGLVDDFDADLANNWRDLIDGARARVTEHYAKELSENKRKLANARKGVFA